MAIRHLIFDLGNVLIDLDFTATERQLRQLLGSHYTASFTCNEQQGLFEAFEKGLISEAEFFFQLRHWAQGAVSVEMLKEAWNAMLLRFPIERLEWISQLRTRYGTYVLSNTNETHLRWVHQHLAKQYGIAQYEQRYFDQVWYSHHLHLRKPELEIFQYVLDTANLPASQTLFVDDNPDNVAAAAQLGIVAVHHPPGHELKQTLAPFLELQ